jgi:hypothetical protein
VIAPNPCFKGRREAKRNPLMFRVRRRSHEMVSLDQFMPPPVIGEKEIVFIGELG